MVNQNGQKNYRDICEQHGEFVGRIHRHFKTDIKMGCPSCAEEHRKKESKINAEKTEVLRQQKITILFGSARIPKRFFKKKFSDYVVTTERSGCALNIASNYASNFPERSAQGGGLIFCGNPGTGKTHLSCSVANMVIRKFARSVLFTSAMSMTMKIKGTYESGSEITESAAINSFVFPELLIIDEVGIQYGTDYETRMFFGIINRRYESLKPTILISNLTLVELKQLIGERVVDRMREGGGAVIQCDWESYRGKATV